jgi:hypothetical protein
MYGAFAQGAGAPEIRHSAHGSFFVHVCSAASVRKLRAAQTPMEEPLGHALDAQGRKTTENVSIANGPDDGAASTSVHRPGVSLRAADFVAPRQILAITQAPPCPVNSHRGPAVERSRRPKRVVRLISDGVRAATLTIPSEPYLPMSASHASRLCVMNSSRISRAFLSARWTTSTPCPARRSSDPSPS